MRIIGDTNIPFLSYRKIALTLSALAIAGGLAYQFLGPGLNLGIDFVGGTQVTLKFRDQPNLGELRSAIDELTVGTPTIQRFGEAENNEVLIRVENPEGEEGDFASPILELLNREFNAENGDSFDLNTNGSVNLTTLLVAADPDGMGGDDEARRSYYEPMAEAVFDYRNKTQVEHRGIFYSLDDLANVVELSDTSRAYLDANAATGAFSLLGTESVGPAVGADLQKKAMLAIGFSLVGMLVYIWIRFQLPYAVGAVAALFHDVLITLTAIAITHREINLPTVAALLTLVGYSVNDTVVVFDRVRENLRLRRGEDLEPLMNLSINQTLSRTFITSGTTLVVVMSLYIFGGDVINVLLIGILVGTYSSIFVASPVALAMNKLLVARRERRRLKGRR
jgi:preprotein translocase subunit SecF